VGSHRTSSREGIPCRGSACAASRQGSHRDRRAVAPARDSVKIWTALQFSDSGVHRPISSPLTRSAT
jgi:hypothetical protein